MDQATKKRLEAAGWRFGDAADFLGMSPSERELLDARVEAALAVRRQRRVLRLTQAQFAARVKTSEPRIVKIERAAPDVTLDQMLRTFAAAGGRIRIRQASTSRASTKGNGKARSRSATIKIELQS